MGFRYRKSIKLGPFQLNLTKEALGSKGPESALVLAVFVLLFQFLVRPHLMFPKRN